ncbi:MAG: hypothetical protein AB7J35_19690 [Dehalococcoidia bacterium]
MTESATLHPLIVDLVRWSASSPRGYHEVMEAWRTSCPRLPVWESAVEAGYLRRVWSPGTGAMVTVTDAGHRFLELAEMGVAAR